MIDESNVEHSNRETWCYARCSRIPENQTVVSWGRIGRGNIFERE